MINPKLIFLGSLFFILFLPLASAECFVYKDSPFYCQDLSQEQASLECSRSTGCNVPEHFSSNYCSSLSECQRIICQSSCTEEYAGNCPKGPVTNSQWCQPGCCQFSYSEINYCKQEYNQLRCEIGANNREVESYRFNPQLSEASCVSKCEDNKSITGEIIYLPQKAKTNETSLSQLEKKTDFYSYFFWVIAIIIIAAVIYLGQYLLKKYYPRWQILWEKKTPEKKNPFRIFSPFFSTPEKREHLEKLKAEHESKIKKQQREEFLLEQGLLAEKVEKKDDYFHKLEKLSKKHPPKPTPPEKSAFERLEELNQK
ncbi:hypothetical protein J4437_04350 [Candidatus Woesearchaeota archaeon]|nr:hypothetical protein [Candidatus Woesearchaeota archaeon]